MPVWTVTANGVRVYLGKYFSTAHFIFLKHMTAGRLTFLCKEGIILIRSNRVPAQNSRV